MSGRQFAGYELLGRLASGGMAELYLARRTGGLRFEKLVALKRLLPNLAREPEYVAMFGDEARILSYLAHPNIVQILDFGKADGDVFMVLEYVHGETLAALIGRMRERGGSLGPRPTCHAGAGVARGLHHAHEARDNLGQPLGVLHRDVSPHNVMIGYDGALKLIDFGVAHAAGRDTRTQRGVLKGKFCYMAPEQFGDGPVGRGADVFALGVVLWEMLTGRRLYVRDSDAATMRAILDEEVPDVRDVAPETPGRLRDLVMRCLAKDPATRPATALEVARTLDLVAADLAPFDQAALGALMGDLFAVERTRKEEMLKVALSPSVDDFLFADRSNGGTAYDTLASKSPATVVRRKPRRRAWRRWRAGLLAGGGVLVTALVVAVAVWRAGGGADGGVARAAAAPPPEAPPPPPPPLDEPAVDAVTGSARAVAESLAAARRQRPGRRGSRRATQREVRGAPQREAPAPAGGVPGTRGDRRIAPSPRGGKPRGGLGPRAGDPVARRRSAGATVVDAARGPGDPRGAAPLLRTIRAAVTGRDAPE